MASAPTIQPYLLGAFLNWCNDFEGRCHIVIREADVIQPQLKSFIKNGCLILNIGGDATRDLKIDDYGLSFNARFNGEPVHVAYAWPQIYGVVSPFEGVILSLNAVPVYLNNGDMGMLVIGNDEQPAREPEPPIKPLIGELDCGIEGGCSHAAGADNQLANVVSLADRRQNKSE